MVSALVFRSNSLGSNHRRRHFVVFLSFSTQVYKWASVTHNAGGSPAKE